MENIRASTRSSFNYQILKLALRIRLLLFKNDVMMTVFENATLTWQETFARVYWHAAREDGEEGEEEEKETENENIIRRVRVTKNNVGSALIIGKTREEDRENVPRRHSP
jgi:hypothetical protein